MSAKGVIPHESGLNTLFELLNRGKKSIAVDLASPSGQEIVHRMASHFDVVVTNLTPHRQERYRVRYEDLSAVNEGLIYVVLTGYGMKGPEKDRSGLRLCGLLGAVGCDGHARPSGITSRTGAPGDGRPHHSSQVLQRLSGWPSSKEAVQEKGS